MYKRYLILWLPKAPDLQYITEVDNRITVKLVEAPSPSNFIAGRPKTALLFWFFGDFRCGVLILMLILVVYKYKNRQKKLLDVRPVCEIAVHLAVVGDVYDGVFFVLSFFPRDVLDEILDVIESVSGGFPTYSHIYEYHFITSMFVS